jgi:type I restriction enzyme S subunit
MPISSVLRVRKEKVNRSRFKFSELQPITIHFDGSIDRRNMDGQRDYTMELFFAHPGDIVVAKIDLKNGAVGIVPDGWKNVVVTNHFAVYEPERSRLLPEYLHRIIQADFFKSHLWRNKVGAEGRKEVKLEFFESLKIPLPPLHIQQAIVARWQGAQEENKDRTKRLQAKEMQILVDVQESLGINKPEEMDRPKAFAVWWSQIDKWGVSMCWQQAAQPLKYIYPVVTVEDVCRISSGGTPSRNNPAYFNGSIPWVKTTEVRNEIIYKTEERLTHEGIQNSSAKIYPAGSLIVAMYGQGATRGRTAKLGIDAATNQACAVLTGFDASIEPDFLWFYLMSQYERLREMASGNNQPNLNAEMIATFPLPLPPLDVQREIMRRVEASRAEIARERETAARTAREAESELEALILGTKQIESPV